MRQVRGLSGSYEDKLKECGLTLLKDRRLRGDLIQTFKIINQVDDIPIDTFFQIAGENHGHATRHAVTVIPGENPDETRSVNNMNLVKSQSRLDIRKNCFSQRVVEPWNSLPSVVKNATSVNNFKNL